MFITNWCGYNCEPFGSGSFGLEILPVQCSEVQWQEVRRSITLQEKFGLFYLRGLLRDVLEKPWSGQLARL